MPVRKESLESELYKISCRMLFSSIFVLLAVGVLKEYVGVSDLECQFYRVLHIYCPGCGGTRAVLALLKGDIILSLWYHPIILYTAIIWGGFMLTQTMHRLKVPHIVGWKFHYWYIWVAIAIILLNWLCKNILLCFYSIKL